MGLKVIIGSTSTPQIDSMCIPHRRNTTPTNIYASDGRQMFEHYHHSSYTADSRGGQEKPALQETWVGQRQNSSFPTKLLHYKFIGGLVVRQTQLTIKAMIFF